MSKIVTMIPVRMASSRLPNKPLININGKTLVQRVYENVKNAIDGDIYIAAGDQVIIDECEKFGAKAILTDPALPSGTDRIAAALKQIDPDGSKYDIVVNFQGDGLNVDPEINNRLIEMIERTDCDIATCGMIFKSKKEAENPANVKIVMGLRN
ncbi:MAG: NTP transferase domain-containing protein [Alphaproteobacteria bacterium]|nr:NTP transferase domain-containing protein [Alphaproteobacteria bacterium]